MQWWTFFFRYITDDVISFFFNFTQNKTLEALENVCKLSNFQGRWQIFCKNPLVIGDVGHNEEGFRLIVKELAKRPGIIKERAQLMDIAYREDTDIEDRTIDSHVKRIRKKFRKIDSDFSAIETRYGSGYRWNVS